MEHDKHAPIANAEPAAAAPALVLYDDACSLCRETVGFLLRIDRRRALTFAALGGATATALGQRRESLKSAADSMIFVRCYGAPDEAALLGAEGAFEIFRAIGGGWQALSWLRLLPRALTGALYSWIARHRQQLLGGNAHGEWPPPEEAGRFLP